MVRRFSVAVLSLSLLPAAGALAQSAATADGAPPPPPPFHQGQHRGPGPMGPRAGMGRVPAPVTNAPFSAKFATTSQITLRDGKQVDRSGERTIYRDSLGRTREDVTLPPHPPRAPRQQANGAAPETPPTPSGPRTMTVIYDPVAGTITHLRADNKTAVVQTVPADFFKHAEKREAREEAGKGPNGNDAVVTDLGSKTFAGVVAQGKRVSRTQPAHNGDAPITVMRESWFAPDLKLDVSDTDTMPWGTRSDVVTSLSRVEPDASLFKVPDGYAIQKVSAGMMGSHGRHGHDGPGGPPPDAPPPAM